MMYMGKGGKIAMIVIGAILLILGIYWAATAGAGVAALELANCGIYTSISSAYSSCMSILGTNPLYQAAKGLVTIFLVVGIIVLAIGALLLIFGLVGLKKA